MAVDPAPSPAPVSVGVSNVQMHGTMKRMALHTPNQTTTTDNVYS